MSEGLWSVPVVLINEVPSEHVNSSVDKLGLKIRDSVSIAEKIGIDGLMILFRTFKRLGWWLRTAVIAVRMYFSFFSYRMTEIKSPQYRQLFPKN